MSVAMSCRTWVGLGLLVVVSVGCDRIGTFFHRQVGFPVELEPVQTCRAPQGIDAEVHDPRLALSLDGDGVVWFERRNGAVYGCDVASGDAREVVPASDDGRSDETLALVPGGAEFVMSREGETIYGILPPLAAAPLSLPARGGASAGWADGSVAARTEGSAEAWTQSTDETNPPRYLEAPASLAYGIALSPRGNRLAGVVGGRDERGHHTLLALWDLESNGSLPTILTHQAQHPIIGVWNLAFSADGTLLLADTQRDGRSGVVLLKVPSGEVAFEKEGFDAYWTRAVALSPDDERLATGDEKGLVRLWDIESGEQVGERMVFGAVVQSLAFSPDGERLAVALSDDRVIVLALRTSR